MRLVIDPAIRSDHGRLEALIRDAFVGVEHDAVELRVRAARRSTRSFTGRAYPSPPRGARVGVGTRYLVVLFVPAVLRNRGYPKTHRYPRLRTAPWITTRDWAERLVALAAHEACHVRQFHLGLRRSEVEAERWAERVLARWATRAEHPAEGHPPRRPEQLHLELAV